jgi:hypothetical protein
MLDRNQQANRLGIPQQMGAFANSLGMVPTPQQEALQEPLIAPETYGIGTMLKKAAPMLPGALGMTVFHGSPHKFDKFDLSKIGSGEGAQAYGHGLYFAENPAVANSYRTALTAESPANRVTVGGKALIDELGGNNILASDVGFALERSGLDPKKAISKLGYGEERLKKPLEALIGKELGSQTLGHNYHVDLPDESIAKMLDWDKPLSQQPIPWDRLGFKQAPAPFEKRFVAPNGTMLDPETSTGQSLMQALGWNAEASSKLREIGIPGVRYLDGGSRTAGKGSSNYVVFDDTLPKIVGKE